MEKTTERVSVADQIRKSLEESIRHAKGEIILRATTPTHPDQSPTSVATGSTKLRADYQLSQADIARLLNVSPKTVQGWEQEIRKPSKVALRLIEVFRSNPDAMLRFIEKVGPQPEVGELGSTPSFVHS